MDTKQLGRRLHEQRLGKGWTLEKLASMTDLTPNYLSAVERGVKKPSLDTFVRLAETLDVSADYLIRDSSKPSSLSVVNDEIHARLSELTPSQQNSVTEILDVLLKNIPNISK